MSDPGIAGPISEFERRCLLLFAHSETVRELIGAADADDAMTGGKLLNAWDTEDGSDPPTVPVIFIAPQQDEMRISPEANVDGMVRFSIHVACDENYRDTPANGRRWFANKVGELLTDLTRLEGHSFGGSTHLRIARRNSDSDGFIGICGPDWANEQDLTLPKDPDGNRTLIAAFEIHLET